MAGGRKQKSNRAWIAAGAIVILAAFVAGLSGVMGGGGGGGNAREFMHIHGLAVDPHRPEIVWLATHQGLIRMTEGEGWQYVGQSRPDLMGFTLSPAESGVFYSSGHPGKGVNLPDPMGLIVTRDAGERWEPVSLTGEVDFHAMMVSPVDPRLIIGWSQSLYRSEDAGITWQKSSPALLAAGVFQFAAHPAQRNQLLAATGEALLKSTDLGLNWESILSGPVTAVAYLPTDPDQVVAYHIARGLVRSADGGGTWSEVGFRAGEKDAVGHIALHPRDPDVIYLSTFGENLMKSVDGGATWIELARGGKAVDRDLQSGPAAKQ